MLQSRSSKLLEAIPFQVANLHEELMQTRAVNQHLTTELVAAQSRISSLLDDVQETRVKLAEEDSAEAIRDVAPSAHLPTPKAVAEETKDLYEHQRRRMQDENLTLVRERDAWFEGAHAIAVAVAEKRALSSALSLDTHQRAWYGLARRFSLDLQATCDAALEDMRGRVAEWRRFMAEWLRDLTQQDRAAQKTVRLFRDSVDSAVRRLGRSDGGSAAVVGATKEELLSWTATCSDLLGFYMGPGEAAAKDRAAEAQAFVSAWTDITGRVCSWHKETLKLRVEPKVMEHNGAVFACVEGVLEQTASSSPAADLLVDLVAALEKLSAELVDATTLADDDKTRVARALVVLGRQADALDNLYGQFRTFRDPFATADSMVMSVSMETSAQCGRIAAQLEAARRAMTSWLVSVEKLLVGINDETPGLIADKLVTVRMHADQATTEMITSCGPMLDDRLKSSGGEMGDDLPFPEKDDLHHTSIELARWLTVAGALATRLVGHDVSQDELELTVDPKTEEHQRDWNDAEGSRMFSIGEDGNLQAEVVPDYDEIRSTIGKRAQGS